VIDFGRTKVPARRRLLSGRNLGAENPSRAGEAPAFRRRLQAALALSGPLILWENAGVSDLGRASFEILRGFVVLLRQTTERNL